MTRDFEVVVISDDENERMKVEGEEEGSEEDEDITPALQTDMAKFPQKSRKEVIAARS